jgi:hypothetical protein
MGDRKRSWAATAGETERNHVTVGPTSGAATDTVVAAALAAALGSASTDSASALGV